jgi:hypothetical protein
MAFPKGMKFPESGKLKIKESLRKRKELGLNVGVPKGTSPWNKNLTKETDERVAKYAESGGKTRRKKVELGIFHVWNEGLTAEADERVKINSQKTTETRKKNGSFIAWNKGLPANKGSGRGKGGFREDIQMYVRSRWEANFARILIYCKRNFEYETQRFPLRFGLYYRPDFIIEYKIYEVKGYLDKLNRIKLKLFRKLYPQYKLVLVNEKFYKKLCSRFSHKIYWESQQLDNSKERLLRKEESLETIR